MVGPLAGLRVIEMAGLGPCPLAGQLLADLGAEVIVIDRVRKPADPTDINRRGKRSIVLDLKSDRGAAAAKALINSADALIEGFRPGVMERLGLGPEDLGDHLVYGRVTGWGQDGPLAQTAGHDINYLSITGALATLGYPDRPPMPPLNLVADYAGGTMFLLLGLLAALHERQSSGKGQTIDAAMTDGVPALMGVFHMFRAQGSWSHERAANTLDGGAPFYGCYQTADDKYMSVGPLEPQFHALLLKKAGLPAEHQESQYDRTSWSERRAEYERIFRTKTREEWAAIFDGTDACVAPVLTFAEVADHPQNAERGTYYQKDGVLQARPAPRFSRSRCPEPASPGGPGADTQAILDELGVEAAIEDSDSEPTGS